MPIEKIIWKYDLDTDNCFYSVVFEKQVTVTFSSPALNCQQVITGQDIDLIFQMLKAIRPPAFPARECLSIIMPSIESEMIFISQNWRASYRWTSEMATEFTDDVTPLEDLGQHIMKILPVEKLGFQFPIKM
jgi:hypothetical protein